MYSKVKKVAPAEPEQPGFSKGKLRNSGQAEGILSAFQEKIIHSGRGTKSKDFLGFIGVAISKYEGNKECEDSGFVARKKDGTILLGVFDGMYGPGSGSMASKLSMGASLDYLLKADAGSLRQAFVAAEKKLRGTQEWKSAGDLKKPGCTACIARLKPGNGVAIAWIGDSRGYVVRTNPPEAELVTNDHSIFNRDNLILNFNPDSLNPLSQEQRNEYVSKRGGIWRFIGNGAGESEVRIRALNRGDFLVLTSDGIGDVLTKNDILHTILSASSPESAALALVNLANSRPNTDYYTNDFGELVFGKKDDRIAIVLKME
ncbi:MAG: PP2C family protein-serine/threonine phosphatase [Candidatus Micrarchaeia archaeon]|jgi:serine/threonine protein phosphatase PrpC